MGYEIQDIVELKLAAFPDVSVAVKVATTFAEYENLNRIGTAGMGPDMDGALAEFADKFIDSWNLTAGGAALSPDGAGFARVPLPLKFAILSGWLDTMRGTSGPLGDGSSSGPDSPEPSTDEPASE